MDNPPKRKSPRLQGYDYSQSGAYFVTICATERQHLFGEIVNGEMIHHKWGRIVEECWFAIPEHYPLVELDGFVVMPNHVHGIIVLHDQLADDERTGHDLSLPKNNQPSVGTRHVSSEKPKLHPLGTIIGSYKSAVTRSIRQKTPDVLIWQSRFHDHIIRTEDDLNRIREYVLYNPSRWEADTFYTS